MVPDLAGPGSDGLDLMMRLAIAGVRPVAMLALLPGFAGAELPWRARLAMASALAALGAFGPQAGALDPAMIPGEIVAGLLAGVALALAFAAASMAGEVAAQMMGLGFATLPGDAGAGGIVGGFLNLLMWAVLLMAGAHLDLMTAMLAGRQVLPPGGVTLPLVAALGGAMFAGGLAIALPVVALLLAGNLLVALAARAVPQLGAMAVGPAALLAAFAALLPMLLPGVLVRMQAVLDSALGMA